MLGFSFSPSKHKVLFAAPQTRLRAQHCRHSVAVHPTARVALSDSCSPGPAFVLLNHKDTQLRSAHIAAAPQPASLRPAWTKGRGSISLFRLSQSRAALPSSLVNPWYFPVLSFSLDEELGKWH